MPFIAYPYEWCFGQFQAAARTTIQVQKIALEHGMTLKDASAFNVGFREGKAVFFDTLSFTQYEEGTPWAAYRQFCQHFLAPLALMSQVDIRLSSLFRTYLDGIPLDLASKLLPTKSWLSPALFIHIHLHSQKAGLETTTTVAGKSVSKTLPLNALKGLLDNLEKGIDSLTWHLPKTIWGDYYSDTNYSEEALQEKETLVGHLLNQVSPYPQLVWDMGANNGRFSRVATERGAFTVAFDSDPVAVEKAWQAGGKPLPLLLDLMNPSSDYGWAQNKRDSLLARGPANVVMALALIHHLAIGNNVPLEAIAAFFARSGHWLLIEFVPKTDSQVQRLLAHRPDIFPHYTEENYVSAFTQHFTLIERVAISQTKRSLWLWRVKAK